MYEIIKYDNDKYELVFSLTFRDSITKYQYWKSKLKNTQAELDRIVCCAANMVEINRFSNICIPETENNQEKVLLPKSLAIDHLNREENKIRQILYQIFSNHILVRLQYGSKLLETVNNEVAFNRKLRKLISNNRRRYKSYSQSILSYEENQTIIKLTTPYKTN